MSYEKIEYSCADKSIEDVSDSKKRTWTEKKYDINSEHPSPEQMLIRQAFKYLTPKQKKVWELWNYDKLTQKDIANKLGIAQQNVSKHLKAIEHRIAKWVKANLGVYKLLKDDYE